MVAMLIIGRHLRCVMRMENSGWDHSMYLALFSRSIVALLLASMNSSVMSLKKKYLIPLAKRAFNFKKKRE